MEKGTQIGLIRHGRTEWNRLKRIQGQHNIPLSQEGRDQVTSWSEKLAKTDWDLLVTSPLDRAVETGQILQQTRDLPTILVPELMEQHWGDWTGETLNDLRKVSEDLEGEEKKGWHFCPPGGESRLHVLQRACAGLRTLAAQHPGKKILVVSHQGVLKCILYHCLNRRFLPEEPSIILPYRLHLLCFRQGAVHLSHLNHLALEH